MSTSNSRSEASSRKVDSKLLDVLKHYDSFYEQAPPIKDRKDEEKPEDTIPDTPQNQAAREFLAKAPTKGLWMPLGKEVKVMKCWRCKNYGHRTGDKECPMFMSGNREAEEFRHVHEDPMYNYLKESETRQKLEKVEMLKMLLSAKKKKQPKKEKKRHRMKNGKRKHRKDDSSDSDSSTSSSSSSSSSSPSSSSSSSGSDRSDVNTKRKQRRKKSRKDHKRHRK